MLEITGLVDSRQMRAQYLDKMDIERERGITIKAQNVRLPWQVDGEDYVLHLIDTPGHVDFSYEVSRSLAACEGAILLVDAAQGIEAQTLANLYLAIENDLTLIPVLNKIDLPAAQPEKYAAEISRIIGCDPDYVLAGQREDRRRRPRADRRGRRPGPASGRRSRRAAARTDLRLDLRHLPRRHHLRPGRRRPADHARPLPDDVDRCSPRDPRGRRRRAGPDADRQHRRRRGRLRDLRRQGRPAGPGRRHDHECDPTGEGVSRRLPPSQADGLLRALSDRRQRLSAAPRRTRQAPAQRRFAGLRARDFDGARASGSGAASSVCSISRSCASGWSASSTSR